MKTKLIIAGFLLASLAGCTDAQRANLSSFGSRHKITLYSGDKIIGQWTSTGKIIHGEGGRASFKDEASEKLVEIYGTWIIEQN